MLLLLDFMMNSLIIAITVMVHYWALYKLVRVLPGLPLTHSLKIVFGVFGALIAHVVEIWVFAVGYYMQVHFVDLGSLQGNFNGSLLDCVYFSFTVYTTVGFGDIEPFGYIRYLTGIESLTGLVLITWTASFLYLEMQRYWDKPE